MHVLDDPHGLSSRARTFLHRAGVRSAEEAIPADERLSAVAPGELLARREWFAERFSGLRYDVRRRVRIGDRYQEIVRCWRFDLLDDIQEDQTGWTFGWSGQIVSSPVSYRVHADGRFGVSAQGSFLEVSPSIDHLIEGHALLDGLFGWEPVSPASLPGWVPGDVSNTHLQSLLDVLPPVPEASGWGDRWWRSDELAIRLFREWTATVPRPTGVMIWCRDVQASELLRRRP
jgi:hypothetical protein